MQQYRNLQRCSLHLFPAHSSKPLILTSTKLHVTKPEHPPRISLFRRNCTGIAFDILSWDPSATIIAFFIYALQWNGQTGGKRTKAGISACHRILQIDSFGTRKGSLNIHFCRQSAVQLNFESDHSGNIRYNGQLESIRAKGVLPYSRQRDDRQK